MEEEEKKKGEEEGEARVVSVPVGCTKTYSIFLGKNVKQSRGTKGNRKSSIDFPNGHNLFFFF